MLEDLVRPKFYEIEDTENLWFMQDGATCHTTLHSVALLREIFPNHLISLRGDICWPARSPDLNPWDFFLWDYLKAKIFSQNHETIDNLKDAIRREVALNSPSMLRKARENFEKRLESCMANNGVHRPDIFKS